MTTTPQVREHPVVRATLANGAEMIILDARVTFWWESGTIRGAAAAVRKQGTAAPVSGSGLSEGEHAGAVTFTRARFQVGALDAILGARPLGEKTVPQGQADNSTWTWSASTSPATPMTWTGTDHTLKGAYDAKVNTFDFYNVSIRFAPVLDATTPPMTLFELVRRYVDPVRAIASIATGTSQPTTYLMASRTEDPTHMTMPSRAVGNHESDPEEPRTVKLIPAWQIYGTGLRQDPYQSHSETVRAHESVLLCIEDGVDLLDLVHAWWKLTDEHHPLIETYAGMLHAQEEHPRSRYLLLIQSLEGMHGHETRLNYEQRKRSHQEHREATLGRIGEQVKKGDRDFIKKFLAREPYRSLETVLKWSFQVHNPDPSIETRLSRTGVVQQLTASEQGRSTFDALRMMRNDLAHGTRGFAAEDLDEVNDILDRVVRAHALRLLGCPEVVLGRLFD